MPRMVDKDTVLRLGQHILNHAAGGHELLLQWIVVVATMWMLRITSYVHQILAHSHPLPLTTHANFMADAKFIFAKLGEVPSLCV